MSGHAIPEESVLIRKLESQLDLERSSVDDLLRLARLYLCPEHDDVKAGIVLRKILERDPGNVWGSYWFASYALYSLMDKEALTQAMRVLEEAIKAHPSESGVLFYMMYYIRLNLARYFGGDFDKTSRIEMLEKSVTLEPNWVSNRRALASAYKEDGRIQDAIAQLKAALANLITNPNPTWDTLQMDFEHEVTGRLDQHAEEAILGELNELGKRKQGR